MTDSADLEARGPYEVPELVVDPPTGITAHWYPNARVVIVSTRQGDQIILSAGEIRALYQWVDLHELV